MKKCAICGHEAHDVTEPGFQGVSLSCPSCDVVYDVPHAGLERLRSMALEDRRSVLAAAYRQAEAKGRVLVRVDE